MLQSLVNNKWVTEEEAPDLDSVTVKESLIANLQLYYDGNVHSELDLRMRSEVGDKGSLCGLAAIYQAGVQTLLSVSEMKVMSAEDVKARLGQELGLDATEVKKMKDKEFLEQFYKKVCTKPVLYTETGLKKYKGNNGLAEKLSDQEYTSGRDCCDICFDQFPATKWISWGEVDKNNYGDCWCYTQTDEPPVHNNGNGNFNRGSCTKYETTSGRKKRQASSHGKTHKIEKRETSETEQELDMRSYGSRLRYECGPARMFYDPDLEEHYNETWMQCNWNKTWTTRDYLDECVWTQCLYPPDPPEHSGLTLTWSGDPVEFFENVSYVCEEDDLYFEWDRDMTEYNLTCQPGGSWIEPQEWPICLYCKYSNYHI